MDKMSKPYIHIIEKPKRSWSWWNTYTKFAAMVTLACIVIQSLGAWVVVADYVMAMVHMPITVAKIDADNKRQDTFIEKNNELLLNGKRIRIELGEQVQRNYESNRLDFDQLRNQLREFSESNRIEHEIIRANQRAAMKTIDSMTNHPPVDWPQKYGITVGTMPPDAATYPVTLTGFYP